MKKVLTIFLFITAIQLSAQNISFTADPENLQSNDMFKCPGMFTYLTYSVLPADTPYTVSLSESGVVIEQGVYSSINAQSPQTFTLNSLIYAGDYTLNVTGASGTVYNPLSFTFNDPLPISFTVAPSDPVSCVLGSILVQNLQGGTAPYDLGSINSGEFEDVYASQVSTSFYNIEGLSSGSYAITAQDEWGCQFTVGDVVPIQLQQGSMSPILSLQVNEQIEFCVQGGEPPFEFAWEDTTVSTFNNCVQMDACWGDYLVTLTDNQNCEDEFEANIPPLMGYIDAETSSVVLEEGTPPFTFTWFMNGELLEGDTTAELTHPMCPAYYEVTITDQIGCQYYFDLLIEELQSNLIESIDCFNTALSSLEAAPIGGTPPYNYLWNTGETTESITLLNPQLYQLELTDNNGCVDIREVEVPVVTDSCLYNAFSPNGDLVNDVWTINPAFLYEDSEVHIYNRWGKRIFKSVGYREPWNGTNSLGRKVADGVYFYVVHLKNGYEPLKGSVSVF